MESSATYYCCWRAMAFCPLDGSFHTKGAPHSPAHIQTLIIMVDLGESKLSHTFIATSCPFQLCYRKQHVKMSKWSWQLWWWAIWGKWDQNNDEVADDVDADDINVCKAISFLGFGKSPKRFWTEGKGGGPWWFKQGTLGPSMRSRLPNLSLKQGNEGGHIFQKRKKNF